MFSHEFLTSGGVPVCPVWNGGLVAGAVPVCPVCSGRLVAGGAEIAEFAAVSIVWSNEIHDSQLYTTALKTWEKRQQETPE